MNLCENVFTYSEIYENDEKKDMQTKKDAKIMRVRALLVFCITFLIEIRQGKNHLNREQHELKMILKHLQKLQG